MILPLQIAYRNMDPSPAITRRIRAEAAKLDRFCPRITSCRVMVEVPHRRHQRGERFHLRIEVGAPGAGLVIRHPSPHRVAPPVDVDKWARRFEMEPRDKDIYAAIHAAFKAARRRLEDHVRKMRGEVKSHTRTAPLRAAKAGG